MRNRHQRTGDVWLVKVRLNAGRSGGEVAGASFSVPAAIVIMQSGIRAARLVLGTPASTPLMPLHL